MYRNSFAPQNENPIPMLYGHYQNFAGRPSRDSDTSRFFIQQEQSILPRVAAVAASLSPHSPGISGTPSQFLTPPTSHSSSRHSSSHLGYHASSRECFSPGRQSSSSRLSSFSSLAPPRRREHFERRGELQHHFHRSVSPSYLKSSHFPSVDQPHRSRTPSYQSSTRLHAPLPFPSSTPAKGRNNAATERITGAGKDIVDFPSFGFRTKAGAAAAARAAAAALARGEPVDPLLFGGSLSGEVKTSRSSSKNEQEFPKELSTFGVSRKGGAVLGPVTPTASTLKTLPCLQSCGRSLEVAEIFSQSQGFNLEQPCLATDKLRKETHLVSSVSVDHCSRLTASDKVQQPTIPSSPLGGGCQGGYSIIEGEKIFVDNFLKEEETRKGTRIISANAPGVDQRSRHKSTDLPPILLCNLRPSTSEGGEIAEKRSDFYVEEESEEVFGASDLSNKNSGQDPMTMFNLCPPSPFSSSTAPREERVRSPGATGQGGHRGEENNLNEKMKSQISRLRLSSSLLANGGDSSLACPPILPMSRKDQIMVDRLSRKVNASSFATVLKAYLIIKTRLAAQRANREYQQEQKRTAPFPFLNRRSSRVALETPPASTTHGSNRRLHSLRTSHAHPSPSPNHNHRNYESEKKETFVPSPTGKGKSGHDRLSPTNHHVKKEGMSTDRKKTPTPSHSPSHRMHVNSRSPSPSPQVDNNDRNHHSSDVSDHYHPSNDDNTANRRTPSVSPLNGMNDDDEESQSQSSGGGGDEVQEVKRVGAVGRMKACQSLLEQRLGFLGFKTVLSVGDGNCQFRSCSWNLFGTEAYHKIVRNRAVKHMRQHQDEYGIFFEGEGEFDKYIKNMSRPGTWGDELCVRAIADSFQCTIHIITSTDTNWYLRYDPQVEGGKTVEPVRHIFLTYISPIHYNSFSIEDVTSSDAGSNHSNRG